MRFRHLRRLRPGERITLAMWNELVELLGRRVLAPDMLETRKGWALRGRTGSGSGGTITAAFAMITSKAGTDPPYVYAAAEATMDSAGNWSQVGGGAAYSNVRNMEEQGDGAQWVNPLLVGDVVLIFNAPGTNVSAYVCVRAHYRGTY